MSLPVNNANNVEISLFGTQSRFDAIPKVKNSFKEEMAPSFRITRPIFLGEKDALRIQEKPAAEVITLLKKKEKWQIVDEYAVDLVLGHTEFTVKNLEQNSKEFSRIQKITQGIFNEYESSVKEVRSVLEELSLPSGVTNIALSYTEQSLCLN